MLVVVLLKEQRNKERMNERKKENVEKEDEPEYKRINWFIIMQTHAIKNDERIKKKMQFRWMRELSREWKKKKDGKRQLFLLFIL